MPKTLVTEDKKSRIGALISGVLIAYAITCIVFIGYAILITYTNVTEQNIPIVVTVTTLIAVLVAGFDAARGADSRGWLWGILAGFVYALILALIGGAVNHGISADSRTLTLLILALAGGGLGGVIGINMRR